MWTPSGWKDFVTACRGYRHRSVALDSQTHVMYVYALAHDRGCESVVARCYDYNAKDMVVHEVSTGAQVRRKGSKTGDRLNYYVHSGNREIGVLPLLRRNVIRERFRNLHIAFSQNRYC
jgi:hypothetical protein